MENIFKILLKINKINSKYLNKIVLQNNQKLEKILNLGKNLKKF